VTSGALPVSFTVTASLALPVSFTVTASPALPVSFTVTASLSIPESTTGPLSVGVTASTRPTSLRLESIEATGGRSSLEQATTIDITIVTAHQAGRRFID